MNELEQRICKVFRDTSRGQTTTYFMPTRFEIVIEDISAWGSVNSGAAPHAIPIIGNRGLSRETGDVLNVERITANINVRVMAKINGMQYSGHWGLTYPFNPQYGSPRIIMDRNSMSYLTDNAAAKMRLFFGAAWDLLVAVESLPVLQREFTRDHLGTVHKRTSEYRTYLDAVQTHLEGIKL